MLRFWTGFFLYFDRAVTLERRAQVHQGDDDHPHPPRVARLSGRASDGGSRGMMVRQPYAAADSRAFLAR
jgi:hypothetical protein